MLRIRYSRKTTSTHMLEQSLPTLNVLTKNIQRTYRLRNHQIIINKPITTSLHHYYERASPFISGLLPAITIGPGKHQLKSRIWKQFLETTQFNDCNCRMRF